MSDEYLNKCYDWIVNVLKTQQRIVELDSMWKACPFKQRISKEVFEILYKNMTHNLTF